MTDATLLGAIAFQLGAERADFSALVRWQWIASAVTVMPLSVSESSSFGNTVRQSPRAALCWLAPPLKGASLWQVLVVQVRVVSVQLSPPAAHPAAGLPQGISLAVPRCRAAVVARVPL